MRYNSTPRHYTMQQHPAQHYAISRIQHYVLQYQKHCHGIRKTDYWRASNDVWSADNSIRKSPNEIGKFFSEPTVSINRVKIRNIEQPDGTRLLVITLASDAQEDNQ